MNTDMHGKEIQQAEFIDTITGNPCDWIAGRGEVANIWLSATNHGDHEEFWIVASDKNGHEIARRNARFCEHITWRHE